MSVKEADGFPALLAVVTAVVQSKLGSGEIEILGAGQRNSVFAAVDPVFNWIELDAHNDSLQVRCHAQQPHNETQGRQRLCEDSCGPA